jgi:hypothetical protein
MPIHLLGIRHHGPGSSRHVLNALEEIKPDIILIEGPPEGESMLSWIGHEDMKPPVALLGYVPGNPQQAVFYPFTDYSPEWNAIKYGLKHKIPIRFIDMPLAHSLASKETSADENFDHETAQDTIPSIVTEDTEEIIKRNPIAYLAEIAGFDDAEEWWEHQFEIANHATEVFDAIATSMTALRDHLPQKADEREAIREAFMRKAIRTAQKEMYADIAVVCGAWHVPALSNMPKQKDDDAVIKNLPKTKVETTWIPWTNDRLSFESGYGAGLESPGWYHHVWHHPKDNGAIWLAHTARIFREHQIDISSAHIIESVRLSNALVGLRSLQRPGLKEHNESTQAVMCMGDAILMKLIHKELIVGKRLGQVPEGTPQVPIHRSFDESIKKFRFKISNDEKLQKLDLREESDLQKSIFLHRLLLLDVPWGKLQYSRGKGTFKEEWILRWYPELTIQLLEKAPWGNTIELASNQYLIHCVENCQRLDEVTKLVQQAIPAELKDSIQFAMERMDALAASTSDTSILMDAFIPLAQISRYGNVRNTDMETIQLILTAIFYRIVAGLTLSCIGIDDQQAVMTADKIKEMHQAIILLEDEELKKSWINIIHKTSATTQAAPLIQGYCHKLLYDVKEVDHETTATAFSKALSINNEPEFSANWLEGFLKDAATILILDDAIWNIVNNWLSALDEAVFLQVIPLLRRTFAVFNNVEKRKIAERAQAGHSSIRKNNIEEQIDEHRAQQILPILETLMGL